MTTAESLVAGQAPGPLLSIAIPTFQRLKWLSKSLAILLEQLANVPAGQVEIVVSENAGTDGTWPYLQALAETQPALRVHRNATNIGGEANFHQLPGMCRGRYLWLLGDDDFLEPQALGAILDYLASDPDFVALNVLLSDEELVRSGKRFWQLAKDREVHSLEEVADIVPHFGMGFISCWVARRELFNIIDKAIYDRFQKWGLSLMVDRYVSVARGSRGIVVATPLLTSRKPPAAEYRSDFDYFEWFVEGSAQLFDFLLQSGLLSKRMIDQRKASMLGKVAVRRIVFERGTRILNRRRVGEILWNHYRSYWQYWLQCLPALYVPGLGTVFRLIRAR